MGSERDRKLDEIRKFEHLLEKQTGKAVRPYRADSYVNLLNRYGTSKDTTEHYHFQQEPPVPDDVLTAYYEGNGLFAKIIDTPAEEAIKHGFEMTVKDQEIQDFYKGALDELDWEETAMTAIKWARLFGGSIVVMMINDGRGIDEPLDWKNIRSIDDLRVYDRSVIQEDTSNMFAYRPDDPFRTRSSRLGMPEYYDVFSRYGQFRVHDSRCLVFQNGLLPENTTNSIYQMWGIPEYVRINRAIRDAEVAHGSALKLLDRSVQAVYKMKDLAAELATEEGESRVLRRLRTIDIARSFLNSITIDAEGEDYDFRTFQFTGVSDVVDSACNYLSALTSIPQTILFGRSPAGMNSTGESDLENWYNYLERIQSRMVKKNLRYLLSIIFQAGVACGEVDEVPDISIEFNPLWSMSESEKAQIDQQKAQTQQVRAQTAQIYMDAQVIDPSEVRRKLADSDEFDIENMLDEIDEEDLFANMPQGGDDDMLMGGGNFGHSGMPRAPTQGELALQENPSAENATETQGKFPEEGDLADYAEGVDVEEHNTDPGTEGSAPTAAPAATKLPEDMSEEEKEKAAEKKDSRSDEGNSNSGNHGHSGRPGEIGGSQPNGGSSSDVSKWSSMPGSEVAKEVSKYGVGSTVQITNRRGKSFTFTKTGDNQWTRSDQPGQTYEDIGVGLNCWKSEIKATAKSPEMPEESRKAEESAEKETEALAKKAESEAAPAATGKYAELGNKAADISQSGMSKEEKGEAYIQMVQDIEPGTTFKVNGTEYRKGTDPDYPYEMIDYKGDYVNAMSSLDFDLKYNADKEGCLTFFDKDAEVQQRKDLAAEMEASGKFTASDEVHGAKEGKITDSSENFGEPGDYIVYRNGNVGSSGMIFYSPVKEEADKYASQHKNGNTSEYEVHLDNPLVVKGDTDVACIRAAYNALHPDKPLKGELTSSKWISCDKQNATALNSGNSGYDSVIYIIGGKPSEVQVSAKKVKSDNVKKTAEYTTTAWSRTGYTYQEAAIRGLVTSDTEDYKRVDGRSDSAGEENIHCSRGRYDEILKEYGGIYVFSDDAEDEDSRTDEGNSNSGNHGHEGRPGEIGGSAPSSSGLNSKVSYAYKSGSYSEVGKSIRSALKDMPSGSTVTSKGMAYRKVDDDKFECEVNGTRMTTNANAIANGADLFNEANAPTFEVASSGEVAEQMVQNGELEPSETTVKIPSVTGLNEAESGRAAIDSNGELWVKDGDDWVNQMTGEVGTSDDVAGLGGEVMRYEGSKDFEYNGSVSQETMDKKMSELNRNQAELEGKAEISSADLESMVGSIKHYGMGGECQMILASQDPDHYQDLPMLKGQTSEEAAAYAKEAENIERYIELSDKVKGSVHRGIGFNDAYDDKGIIEDTLSQLRVGNTISMGHIASWSDEKGIAKSYAEAVLNNEWEDGQNYAIVYSVANNKSAVSLEGISPQGECITPKSASYSVTNVNYIYDEDLDCHRYEVEMEEV